jgi:hypothetical protein
MDQPSGRIAYGDAIFLRTEAEIIAAAEKDEGASVLRAMIALLAYGKADHAAALLDRGSHVLPAERRSALQAALLALARGRSGAMIASLLRRLGGGG